MNWDAIPKEAYALIGTVIGAVIGVLSPVITQRSQRNLERDRLRATRIDSLYRDMGTRFQALATDFGSAAHSMCWLTWDACQGSMSKDKIIDYNKEMHIILPKLIGGHIAISALDGELEKLSDKFVNWAHDVDEEIGKACLIYEKEPIGGMELLKRLNAKAREFDEAIFSELGAFVRGKQTALLGAQTIER
jgi:hypothetical protein